MHYDAKNAMRSLDTTGCATDAIAKPEMFESRPLAEQFGDYRAKKTSPI